MSRKKILNFHEEATHVILQKVARENGARVFAKIRIADVLEIAGSGISKDEYSYALKAHFDFVISDTNGEALFAVEFDGPYHDIDKLAMANDAKKNSICKRFNLPLLRITTDFVMRPVGQYTLLGWLAELWFVEQAFKEAQNRGEIDPFEPFNYFSVVSRTESYPGQEILSFPYDLSRPHRLFLKHLYDQGKCKDYIPSIHSTFAQGAYVRSLALLRVTDRLVITAQAGCRAFDFSPVMPWELCEELAIIDIGENVKRFMQGTLKAIPIENARLLLQRFKDEAANDGLHVLRAGLDWN